MVGSVRQINYQLMMSAQARFQQEFRLLRTRDYDNSQARQTWTPYGLKGTWAWCVKVDDLDVLYDKYYDQRWQIVRPSIYAPIYAALHREVDRFVCNQGNSK